MEVQASGSTFKRFDKNTLPVIVALSILYYLWHYFVIGLRPDHFYLYILVLAGYYSHPVSRKVVLGLSIFLLFIIIWDSQKAFPNYSFNPVNIQQPYELEKYLFGIDTEEGTITLNQYFKNHTNAFLDAITGIFYLTWVPVPLMMGIYFVFKNKVLLFQFSSAFMLVNLLGWTIYYIYPEAPPWYVELYGFTESFDVPGNAAGLIRFDNYFDIAFFRNLYSNSSNVFASMPSLHSAYPIVVFFYGWKKGLGWLNWVFFILIIGIWFSAVYTGHHYIIDVILGAVVAGAGILIFEEILLKTRVHYWINSWASKI